ncbi:cytochrome c [Nannocystis sp. RBIL2]|uniref:c-type cytochrome n=1 Tax=Nannocystis sp. RBIL2 TaxID=2996788 RepID=UPI00226DA139|nr:cytochrome c [Nannocystis sp. RBIL2]MCY1070978.1 cytochrome c [Nannocystis sp. RBIL2]
MPDATRTFALCCLLAACTDEGSSASVAASHDSEAEISAVTYHGAVKAILDAKCVQCHASGGVGPLSLQTYEEARVLAPVLADMLAARIMPPWPPDDSCRAYRHDRSLSEEQERLLLEWVDQGIAEGDPTESLGSPSGSQDELEYDITLALDELYTPVLLPDEYRCFLLPWPSEQGRYITGLGVVPGDRQMIHHVAVYAIPPADVAVYRALDDADPAPGYVCYGGPGGGDTGAGWRASWLRVWVPGSTDDAMPEGTGIRIEPGSMIAVQMHYHTPASAQPGPTRIAFRTAAAVARPAVVLPFTNPFWVDGSQPMRIPAGDAAVTHSFEFDVAP